MLKSPVTTISERKRGTTRFLTGSTPSTWSASSSSRQWLVGKNARAATGRTSLMFSLLGHASGGANCDQKAYAIRPVGANHQPLARDSAASESWYQMVCSAGFGEDGGAARFRRAG